MVVSLQNKIQAFVNADAYINCLLIVHPDISTLEDVVNHLHQAYNLPLLDVSGQLSQELLSISDRRRSRDARIWIQDACKNIDTEVVTCINIDLLFEPSLGIDPLQLFRQIGREQKIIVAWPGTFKKDTLSYAVPEHDHYVTWQNPEVDIYCPR
jgi:hypothetical protein